MKLIPMPGKALVAFEPFWDNVTGAIAIPDFMSTRLKTTGTLLALTPARGDRNAVDLVALSVRSARVIVTTTDGLSPFCFDGREHCCIVRVSSIEAEIGEDVSAEALSGRQRCKHCGPAIASESSNGMILVEGPTGLYCPRCHRDVNGQIVDPCKVKLHDAELERFNDDRARTQEALMKMRGQEPPRKIISVANDMLTVSGGREKTT